MICVNINIRKWVPLLTSFIECKARHRKDAFKEIFLILLLSLLPIWGGALLNIAVVNSNEIGFIEAINNLIKNGELILYSTSILAPIFYLVLHEPQGGRKYPERYFQGVVILFLLIISLLLFSAQRQTSENTYVFNWSVLIFSVSVVFLYLATVFRNWMNDSPDMRSDERSFVEQYHDRRVGDE